MSMEDNKAIVRRFLEALDRQNFDALKEHPGLYQTVVRQPIIRALFLILRQPLSTKLRRATPSRPELRYAALIWEPCSALRRRTKNSRGVFC
jgi:hypothetical protein